MDGHGKSDKVWCYFAQANSDEEQFPEPDAWTLHRDNVRQLTIDAGIQVSAGPNFFSARWLGPFTKPLSIMAATVPAERDPHFQTSPGRVCQLNVPAALPVVTRAQEEDP